MASSTFGAGTFGSGTFGDPLAVVTFDDPPKPRAKRRIPRPEWFYRDGEFVLAHPWPGAPSDLVYRNGDFALEGGEPCLTFRT